MKSKLTLAGILFSAAAVIAQPGANKGGKIEQNGGTPAASKGASGKATRGNGNWFTADYDADGKTDLVFLKMRNTPNNKVEVHVASAASGFKNRIIENASVFTSENNGTWTVADYDGDKKPDLVYIKTRNTASGKVEVHVASASSYFQTFLIQTPTAFSTEDNGTWTVADYDGDNKPDLVYIKTRKTDSKKVELHVLSAASNFQTFLIQTPTVFTPEDNGTWTVGDYDGDKKPELVYVKSKNAASKKVELHILSATSNFQTFIIQTPSTYDLENNGNFTIGDQDSDGKPDLVYVKERNTANNLIEMHAASASSNFMTRIVATGTDFLCE